MIKESYIKYFKSKGNKKALELIKLAGIYEAAHDYENAVKIERYIELLKKEASFFDLPQFRKPRFSKTRKKYTKGPKPISNEVRVLETRIDPAVMAAAIYQVIEFVLAKVPPQKRTKRKMRIQQKIMQLNPNILSSKRLPESSSIGQTLTIIKNMMFGKSQPYIASVLRDLLRRLA